MIIIADDTFIDRPKFNDVSYLQEELYQKICTVKSNIKTIDMEELQTELQTCKMFLFHRSLQLKDVKSNSLNYEANEKLRNNLINTVIKLNIPHIEFGRGIETKIEAKQLNKDLFYDNLKDFLDYYLAKEILEIKILFYGKDFEEMEKMTVIQNALVAIRLTAINEFKNNPEIIKGLSLLYKQEDIAIIIGEWQRTKLSKNEIINQINTQILK